MNTSTKFGTILISEKAKIVFQNMQHSILVTCNYLTYNEVHYKLSFKGHT